MFFAISTLILSALGPSFSKSGSSSFLQIILVRLWPFLLGLFVYLYFVLQNGHVTTLSVILARYRRFDSWRHLHVVKPSKFIHMFDKFTTTTLIEFRRAISLNAMVIYLEVFSKECSSNRKCALIDS